MKSTDKILMVIVAGVILLIGVSFAVAFLQSKPDYKTEDTAEAVAHNYLLSMQRGDFERAYGYLSPALPGYPRNVESFTVNVNRYIYGSSGQRSYEVISSNAQGNLVTVKVRETVFYQGDLFNSGESTRMRTMTLSRSKTGKWGITQSDIYWAYCWGYSKGCP